jgi:endonuclease/exonuclease/phosphatase family metal-dependent hydrolase
VAAFLVTLLATISGAGLVTAAVVGDRVELRATHPSGVPLHKEPRGTHDFQRVLDGTVATVMDLAHDGRWLKLTMPDGRTGWITVRYVGPTMASTSQPTPPATTDVLRPDTPTTADDPERLVWTSPEGCRRVLSSGARLGPPHPGILRLGTWNIRWFPRGCPSADRCPHQATDVAWLACTIAWMHVDLLALQEILTTPDAQTALQTLRADPNRLTGGTWQVDLQDCGAPSSQHVGFLWNSARVTLSGMTDVWELNGAATSGAESACARNLRPGRSALVKSAGGVDVHLLAVHFDSGTTNRDYQHRRQAARRLKQLAVGGVPLLARDPDVIVAGDFNTMGRQDPTPVSASQELMALDQELAPGFRRLGLAPNCTTYHERQGQTLDHIVASVGMHEVAPLARVTGYCALARCQEVAGTKPAAAERLSDHCPLVVDVRDEDRD